MTCAKRLRSVPPLPLPFGYLTQTSSERNPPHGWAFRFSVGEVPIFTAQQMEQMRQEVAVERERRASAEWVLKEIRIRLHAAGRRPEECWEMSEIDGHLAQ